MLHCSVQGQVGPRPDPFLIVGPFAASQAGPQVTCVPQQPDSPHRWSGERRLPSSGNGCPLGFRILGKEDFPGQ